MYTLVLFVALVYHSLCTIVQHYHRSWFTKAEQLRQRQEELITNRAQIIKSNQEESNKREQASIESDNSDDEELDFDALLNWRAKVS